MAKRTKSANKPTLDLRFQTLSSPFIDNSQVNTEMTDSGTNSSTLGGINSLPKRTISLQLHNNRERSPLKNKMLRQYRAHNKASSPSIAGSGDDKIGFGILLERLDHLRTKNKRLREEYAFVESLKEAIKSVKSENRKISNNVPLKVSKAMKAFKNSLLSVI